MTVKAAYFVHGIIMGDTTENLDGTVTMENPIMVIPQPQNMAFMPFLSIMEEKTITFKLSDAMYGGLFTPVIEMRNQYNKLFGTGIVEAGANILQL